MTTPVRTKRPHLDPTALVDARTAVDARPRPTTATDVAGAPSTPGFVLHVGVDESFGHGPQALRDLIEAAETLQELARDLLPRATTFTTLALTPPAAD